MALVVSQTVSSSDLDIKDVSYNIGGIDMYYWINNARGDMFQQSSNVTVDIEGTESRIDVSLTDQEYGAVSIIGPGDKGSIASAIINPEFGLGTDAESVPADIDFEFSLDLSGDTNSITVDKGAGSGGTFEDGPILIMVYWDNGAFNNSNWQAATKTDKNVSMSLKDGIKDSYCGGETAEAVFKATGAAPLGVGGGGSVQVVSNNLITGGTSSEQVTVDSGQTKDVTASVDIPENTVVEEEDIISVEVQ